MCRNEEMILSIQVIVFGDVHDLTSRLKVINRVSRKALQLNLSKQSCHLLYPLTSFVYVIIVLKKKRGLEKTTIQCKSEATPHFPFFVFYRARLSWIFFNVVLSNSS